MFNLFLKNPFIYGTFKTRNPGFEYPICTIRTVENLKKKSFALCSLFSTNYFDQISPNKSEAREPEGLVKITYGIVASSLFKRAGNSNKEQILNCLLRKIVDLQVLFFPLSKSIVNINIRDI